MSGGGNNPKPKPMTKSMEQPLLIETAADDSRPLHAVVGGAFTPESAAWTARRNEARCPGGAKAKQTYDDEWYTDPRIVIALGRFDLDPCAGPLATLADQNIRPPQNGLSATWNGRVWLNPPFSAKAAWLGKLAEHGDGIAMVPARLDASWMHQAMDGADAMHIFKGRPKYIRNGQLAGSPSFGSVLLAYGPRNVAALIDSGLPGRVVMLDANITGAE